MLNNIVEWEELSMKDKAAFIRDAVSRGLKDIDSIKLDYNEFKKGGPTKKQVFLNTLELSLKGNSRYNTPLWRKYLTDLANMESGYNAGITNSIGAKGYFQLMPSNRSSSWNSPTLQFTEMYKMSDANMDYLRRNMTENDLKLALLKGIDIYGLMAGAHLGGAKNALKALRGTGNAKDMNGTSVLSYMTRFSQTPSKVNIEGSMIPIVDNTGLANTSTPNNISLDTNIPLPIEINIPEPINIDDDNTAGNVLPEVEVIGYRKPNLVAMQEFIEDVSNSTPTMQPIYKVEPTPSIYDKMNLLSTDRVTLLQRDLEDRIIAEDRRRRLGYSYKDDFSNDIQDLRFIRNMSSKGGLLYPIGGSMITVNPGDRVSTDNCAEWSNGLLRDNGYLISGNAWGLNHVDPVFNGFEGLTRPENYNLELVKAYNHLATDNVFKNFDSKTLDVTKPYVVNMYYNNSEALESAYNDGRGVTGTHTGVLTYDEPTKKWWVTHNIHGNIHLEPFIDLQKNTGKYGVTAIYAPRPKTVWNRVKGFFGFEDGGPLNLFETGGPVLFKDMPKRPLILSPDKINALSPEDRAAYHKAWEDYNKAMEAWDTAFDALQLEIEKQREVEFQRSQLELANRTPEQIRQMGIDADRRYRERNPNGGEADPELQRKAGLIISAMQDLAPITGEAYRQAAEEQRQRTLDKWHDYRKGINATITAAELGLSGGSLLGAYANWRNWANSANLAKQSIANLLLRALLPMQVGGTLIDAYQTYDASLNNDDFNKWYNAGSTGLGVAGSVGASDVFLNNRFHNPYIDRTLDVLGVMQNAGDFLKFGYDTYKNVTENK